MPFGRRGAEQLAQVRVAVIDAGVKAERLNRETAFLGTAGDADHARALELGDLADERTDRPGRGRHDHRLPGLRLPDVQKSYVGGESGHAQHAECIGELGDGRVDLDGMRRVDYPVVLPADRGEHQIAHLESFRVRGLDHADRLPGHRCTDRDRFRVRGGVAHAPAHVGIQ